MKKIIATILLLMIMVLPVGQVAYAEEAETPEPVPDPKPMVHVTKAMVNDTNGRILIVTRYILDEDLSITFDNTVDGVTEQVTLTSDKILKLVYLSYYNKMIVDYDENIPNELTIYNKIYNSRWDYNHENGITGDEIDDPLPVEEGFWFNTYISEANGYLSDGGIDTLHTNYSLLSKIFFGKDYVDMSQFVFNYCYGTEYKNITSNATIVREKGDMYYHIYENINPKTKIILYQKVQNTVNWYCVIIGVSVGIILIGFVIYMISRRRRKHNGEGQEC